MVENTVMNRDEQTNENEKKGTQPDNETLHTTDPEKNMEGPVSSSTRKTGEVFDSGESKESADERRDQKM